MANPSNTELSRQMEAQEIIRQAMTAWGTPGLSVAVASPDGLLWTEGFGLADMENRVPATEHSVYRMASVSKPITATAVMQLAERGALDLDAPVQKYLPAYPRKSGEITTRLLLSHLSGIRDFSDAEGQNVTYYPYDSTPLLRHVARFQDDPLLHEPGTKFRYSSPGYVLLGCLVEAASGENYLPYVRDNIFALAQMRDTGPDDVRALIPHRARGYERGKDRVLRPAPFAERRDGSGARRQTLRGVHDVDAQPVTGNRCRRTDQFTGSKFPCDGRPDAAYRRFLFPSVVTDKEMTERTGSRQFDERVRPQRGDGDN